ncbi:MAG TPA: sialidase family protein [Clostridia bacterium]|nr:sialidase family protein [Clostridia bacterium]
MNEITLNPKSVLRASAQNGIIEIACLKKEQGEQAVLLGTIDDMVCTRPFLFIDKNEALWLFYTAVHCVDEDTQQPMAAFASKGSYGEDFIKWDWRDAIYPRLGGSFTDATVSAGVNEAEDVFAPELCRRYEAIGKVLAGKSDFSKEKFDLFLEEKRSLALGKLYGVKIDENHYPFARRTGFSMRGKPLEYKFEGKKTLLLPIYSNVFSCALLLYSFDNGANFDSRDYLMCSPGDADEFVLKEDGGTVHLAIKTVSDLLPVGKTADLGKTWENHYDASQFVLKIGSGEALQAEKKWYRQNKIKVFAKPAPAKFFRLVKTIVKNEKIFDFSKKKKTDQLTFKQHEPTQITGLKGYGIPVIEDVFPLIKEHAHGSGITALHNGELISVWFQSDGERKGNDGRILAARKPIDAPWQVPFVIADVAGMADCNPTVFVDKNDRLWFFWYPVLSNCWETSQPKYRYAEKGFYEYENGYRQDPEWASRGILNPSRHDELQGRAEDFENARYVYGEVNGECRYITADQFEQHRLPANEYVKIEDRYITDSFVVALRNSMLAAIDFIRADNKYAGIAPLFEMYIWWETERICKVAAGADMAYKKWRPITRSLGWQTKNKPMEFEFEGKTRLMLPLYSDGIHCSLTAFTDDGGETWSYGLPFASTAPEQAASVVLENGTLRSYFRNGEPTNRVISYESRNGGASFGNMCVEQALKHEGGFDMVKLQSGLWLMSITDAYKDKGVKAHNRSRLQIAVSKDEGETWTLTPLELDTNGWRSYGYSAITQGPDGDIYVTYSYDDENGMNNIRCATIRKDTF